MSLKERIRQRMEEKRVTFTDLVRETKLSKSYLWEILDGTAPRPSADTLYKIAQVLGTSMADLLGKEQDSVGLAPPTVPEPLEQLAKELNLPYEDIRMLAAIKYRGGQPKTKDDWKFLYESVKRSIRS